MVNTETPTPPKVVNAMLDLIPDSVWTDDNATILCPACKDGIFLREATLRILRKKYEQLGPVEFRKQQDALVDHILRHRMFGIAISYRGYRVTKRSLYTCSNKFSDIDNIYFNEEFGRYVQDKSGREVEKQCFHFIENIDEVSKFFEGKGVKNMQFDVIIGNPPYQLSIENTNQREDSLAKAGAIPIYQKFIDMAQKLNPKYVTMIVPSRWYAGGRGLDQFRKSMLSDTRVRILHDFFDSTECFAAVDISGGICYFLWDRDYKGKCTFVSHLSGKESSDIRALSEFGNDKFVRFNEGCSIISKIQQLKEKSLINYVSSQNPFGLGTNFRDFKEKNFSGALRLYAYPKKGWVDKQKIKTNIELISKWKVFIANAYGERGTLPYLVLGKPFVGGPDTVSTATYKILHCFETEKEAVNFVSYVKTKFFRFLVLLLKNTQHAPAKVYSFVPVQDFKEPWDDKKLYKKYKLTEDEIAFIESMVRPMADDEESEPINIDIDDE